MGANIQMQIPNSNRKLKLTGYDQVEFSPQMQNNFIIKNFINIKLLFQKKWTTSCK